LKKAFNDFERERVEEGLRTSKCSTRAF